MQGSSPKCFSGVQGERRLHIIWSSYFVWPRERSWNVAESGWVSCAAWKIWYLWSGLSILSSGPSLLQRGKEIWGSLWRPLYETYKRYYQAFTSLFCCKKLNHICIKNDLQNKNKKSVETRKRKYCRKHHKRSLTKWWRVGWGVTYIWYLKCSLSLIFKII